MTNWWTRIGCFLTGWNINILETCTEASRKQLKKYTSAILILVIIWGFIGYAFADRYVRAPWWGCMIVASIFVVIIIQIERQIILTVGKNRKLAIFRILIAIIMAILGSAITDQIIFKEDIEKKMIQIVDRQVTEQLPNRLNVIDKKLQSLQIEIDSLDKKTLQLYDEINKRPTINIVSTSSTRVPMRQEDGTIKYMPQNTIDTSPIVNPKSKQASINNQHLDVLRLQQENYTKAKMSVETSLRKELKSKQGFLEELNAIVEILGEKPVALIFYLILFCFLMFLELFVVMSKTSEECDYDLVVKHQLDQKKRTLNELIK